MKGRGGEVGYEVIVECAIEVGFLEMVGSMASCLGAKRVGHICDVLEKLEES